MGFFSMFMIESYPVGGGSASPGFLGRNRVEDTRFRSVPSAMDGDCWSVSSNIFYFDTDTVLRSCEYRKRVEAIFPVD